MHLCHSGHWQINYIVLMTKEGSTKIVHFVTHGAGVLMLRCDHLSHYSEYSMHYLPLYQNKAHYLQLYYNAYDHNAVFLCRFLFYHGAVDMQIWVLLTRHKSLIQMSPTDKKCVYSLFFTHMETSPLPVKGCKIWPRFRTHGYWSVMF